MSVSAWGMVSVCWVPSVYVILDDQSCLWGTGNGLWVLCYWVIFVCGFRAMWVLFVCVSH